MRRKKKDEPNKPVKPPKGISDEYGERYKEYFVRPPYSSEMSHSEYNQHLRRMLETSPSGLTSSYSGSTASTGSTMQQSIVRFGRYVPRRLWHLTDPVEAYRKEQADRSYCYKKTMRDTEQILSPEEKKAKQEAAREKRREQSRQRYIRRREQVLAKLREQTDKKGRKRPMRAVGKPYKPHKREQHP